MGRIVTQEGRQKQASELSGHHVIGDNVGHKAAMEGHPSAD